MPVSIRLNSQKTFSQQNNGNNFSANPTDFSKFVKANILEKVRIETEVIVGWYADIADANFVFDQSDVTKGFIYAPGVDFLAEGFYVGNNVHAWSAGSRLVIGDVESINGDYIYLENVSNLVSDTDFTFDDTGILKNNDINRAIDFGYKLVATDESFNTLSRFTNTEQRFYAQSTFSNTVTASPYDPTNLAWKSGDLQFQYVGKVQDESVDYPENQYLKYKFTHDIVINPFYLDGELRNLINGIPPTRLKGESTLNYQLQVNFKDSINNPNISQEFILETWNSSIGWFNENLNGFPNKFSSDPVVYTNLNTGETVTQLEANAPMRVQGTINGYVGAFAFDSQLTFGLVKVLTVDKYENSPLDWIELWNYESITLAANGGVGTSGIISNFDVNTVVSDKLTFTADLIFDPEQISRIQNGDYYVLFAHVQSAGRTNENTDKVCLPLDINQFYVNTDIEGLAELDYMRVYDGREVFDPNTLGGRTSIKCFNESELILDYQFRLLKEKLPVIKSISLILGAYNTVTDQTFSIQEYDLPLEFVVVDGVQKINFESDRGYNLLASNQFNLVTLEDISTDPTETTYRGQIALKINWQEWVELAGVDTIFLNNNAPFDGFNQKSSNYSLSNDYEIRIWLDLTLNAEGVNTLYRLMYNRIEVTDYETNHVGVDVWDSCDIQTWSEDETINLNGKILENENTLVKAVFIPNTSISDSSLYFGALRIQVDNQPAFDQDILHSEFVPISSSILQPITGNDRLDLSVEGGNLVLKGIIDSSKTQNGVTYVISAECDQKNPAVISGAYSLAYNKQAYN